MTPQFSQVQGYHTGASVSEEEEEAGVLDLSGHILGKKWEKEYFAL